MDPQAGRDDFRLVKVNNRVLEAMKLTRKTVFHEPAQSPEILAFTERQAVSTMVSALAPLGVSRFSAIGIWIALKSKPVLVFCGPKGSGKEMVALAVANMFVRENSKQLLQFQGHPWWAASSGNMSLMTMAQERLTSCRLRLYLEEAERSESNPSMFFAVFSKISRAELSTIFTPPPPQVQNGNMIRIPFDLAEELVRLPGNVYLLASMDIKIPCADVGISQSTSMLFNHFSPLEKSTSIQTTAPLPSGSLQSALFASRRFDPARPWTLAPNLRRGLDPLRSVREVLALLGQHRIRVGSELIQDAYLYIRNAWDAWGQGLFDENPSSNTNEAYNFWLQNAAIPKLFNVLQENPDLYSDLRRLLSRQSAITSTKIFNLIRHP